MGETVNCLYAYIAVLQKNIQRCRRAVIFLAEAITGIYECCMQAAYSCETTSCNTRDAILFGKITNSRSASHNYIVRGPFLMRRVWTINYTIGIHFDGPNNYVRD